MPVAKRIEAALEEIAALDHECMAGVPVQRWDAQTLARREALVGEVGELCQAEPLVAAGSYAGFVAMLERTERIEEQLREERSTIAQALIEAETSLRQLGAFGERVSADATLLNRLA
ncbi:MAG: hypothetical protein NTW74_02465 [Acidobacteria bacterium]|nr:hypothetical protein [Acidobacteriota bacterium]